MPKVPIIEAPEAQLRPVGTPYSNINPPPIGLETARGLGEAGQALQEVSGVLAKERNDANTMRVADASNQLSLSIARKMRDKDTGFLWKQGKDAFESAPDTFDSIAQDRDKILGSLNDGMQKREFQKKSNEMLLDTQDQIESHAGREKLQYYHNTAKSNEASLLDSVHAVPLNPQKTDSMVDSAVGTPDSPNAIRIALRGQSQDVIDQTLKDLRQRAHVAAINGFRDLPNQQGIPAAMDYYKKVRGELGHYEEPVRQSLEHVYDGILGETESRKILSQYSTPIIDSSGAVIATKINEAGATADANKLEPGPVSDQTRQRVFQNIRASKQQYYEAGRELANSALAQIGTGTDIRVVDNKYISPLMNKDNGWGNFYDELLDRVKKNAQLARGDTFDSIQTRNVIVDDIYRNQSKYRGLKDINEFRGAMANIIAQNDLPQMNGRNQDEAEKEYLKLVANTMSKKGQQATPLDGAQLDEVFQAALASRIVSGTRKELATVASKGGADSAQQLRALNYIDEAMASEKTKYMLANNNSPPPPGWYKGSASKFISDNLHPEKYDKSWWIGRALGNPPILLDQFSGDPKVANEWNAAHGNEVTLPPQNIAVPQAQAPVRPTSPGAHPLPTTTQTTEPSGVIAPMTHHTKAELHGIGSDEAVMVLPTGKRWIIKRSSIDTNMKKAPKGTVILDAGE